MSKSYVSELVRVYKAIFTDVQYAQPALRNELDKSFARLARVADQVGIVLFAQWLPALGKHLDRCLSEGEYKQSGLPFSKGRPGCVRIPLFCGELYLLVFRENGSLREDYDITAITFLRQILYAAKKAKVMCSPGKVTAEKQAFLEIDASLPAPESFWDGETSSPSDISSTYRGFAHNELIRRRWEEESIGYPYARRFFLEVLDTVSSILSATLGPFQAEEWRHRHGPGVVSNRSSGEYKYEFVNWSNRLEREFPYADHAFHSYAAWAGNEDLTEFPAENSEGPNGAASEEAASRLIDVPKTFDKPRLIAAEPSENMWCQQLLWHYMRTQVRSSWISEFVRFNDQTLNQELCKKGSMDGALATVDLSAASDRVTCLAVGELFRGNPGLLLALQSTRTRYVDVQLSEDSEIVRVPLKKYSTMGNATTFPVETLLFLTISLSSVLVARQMRPTIENIRELMGQVAVFGDDIIVPIDSREVLVRALKTLFFKVNDAKTFWTGMFRESCGVDAFAGEVVTPVYWQQPYELETPESLVSLIEVAKNFYKRFYVTTSEYLRSTASGEEIPQTRLDSEVQGWTSFVDPGQPRFLKTRWNKDLQRREYKMLRLSTKRKVRPILDDSMLLQFFTEYCAPRPWVGGIGDPEFSVVDKIDGGSKELGLASRPETTKRLRWVPAEMITLQV